MHKAHGFTLIELMVTVAIVAILGSIALPAYNQYVQRGKITEATSSLSELRLRAEKFFADNRTYLNAGGTAVGFNITLNNARYFDFVCNDPAATATTFTCKATGKGDMGGFVYTIDQTNTRKSTFTGLPGWNNSTTCWVTKKGESC